MTVFLLRGCIRNFGHVCHLPRGDGAANLCADARRFRDIRFVFIMKQIIALVKPFRAEAVIQALTELDITACVVTEAKGYGRQKGYLARYVGSEYSLAFLPKVEISAWVPDRLVRKAIDIVVQTARTGRMGDGKILVLPVTAESIEF